MGLLAPPTFNAAVVIRKKLRFVASGAGQANVTQQNILDLLCVATSATAAYRLMSAVRIRNITVWGPMSSSLVPVTVSVEYPNVSYISGPTKIRSDSSMGATKAGLVIFPPPPDSMQVNWLADNSQIAAILQIVTGSVVDIDLDLVLQNGETPVAVSAAVAGATVGEIYCRALDSTGSKLLTPVSYPTI